MNELIQDAIQHYEYGINHDIFSEPVTTYARLAVKALRRYPEHETLLNRWGNVRIYEPGENVRTIGSNCEVLIRGADLISLMNPEPRQLTLDELRQMNGQPVWVNGECALIHVRHNGEIYMTRSHGGTYYVEGATAYNRLPGGDGK